ncbi:MAG: ABC transporter ATP-binding protein [Pseudomonadota bacterium]
MSEPGVVDAAPAAIELDGIDKRFGAVHANRAIDLRVAAGSVHGIVGENGAGKSTLMNILYGFYRADSGTIRVDGQELRINGPEDAIRAGIGMVHQHFMLIEPFTVLENLLLGAEGGWRLAPGRAQARAEIERLEQEYRLQVDLDARIRDLSVGLQQRVEILKALYRGARILILDEPTGVLTPQEADELFRILGDLRAQGRTVILITHKLREIMAITDRVSVMRQGAMVAHRATVETSTAELAELMVGRKVLLRVEKGEAHPREPVLAVEHVAVRDGNGVVRVDDASLQVRAGEIVGIAGVSGNGQTELLEAIAGIRPVAAGVIRVAGEPVVAGARLASMGHVPEDRLRMGLVRSFPAWENAILGHQKVAAYGPGAFLDRATIIGYCKRWMQGYDVRPGDPELAATSFSGGNQQKQVVAREVEHDPILLLIGQPTRGVDIGAIEFIHQRLVELRDAGKAVLLVSVELDEIMGLADRILVMCGGKLTGQVDAKDADERRIGLMMAGVTETAA